MRMHKLYRRGILCAALALLAGASPALAGKGTITVVGEGEVSARPDVARLNVGFNASAPTVREAMVQNRSTMEQILEALKKMGVADEDIATNNYSIHFEQPPPQEREGQTEARYWVNNMVNVVIRDLERIDDVLDAATEAGANQVWGVDMAVDDSEELASRARAQAVEKARAKAGELAALHGRKLGRLQSVSEIIGGMPGFHHMAEARVSGGGPIRPGEQKYQINLQVVYELD